MVRECSDFVASVAKDVTKCAIDGSMTASIFDLLECFVDRFRDGDCTCHTLTLLFNTISIVIAKYNIALQQNSRADDSIV